MTPDDRQLASELIKELNMVLSASCTDIENRVAEIRKEIAELYIKCNDVLDNENAETRRPNDIDDREEKPVRPESQG